MSNNETQDRRPQLSQALPKRQEQVDLGKQYKTIGISAVSAAAAFKDKKKPAQQA